MQFYAVEIVRLVIYYMLHDVVTDSSRNRAGLNDWIYEQKHASGEK